MKKLTKLFKAKSIQDGTGAQPLSRTSSMVAEAGGYKEALLTEESIAIHKQHIQSKVPAASAVQTFSGFDDWLSSFQPVEPVAAELPDDNRLGPAELMQKPPEKIIKVEITDDGDGQVDPKDMITIILSNLHKPSYEGKWEAKIKAPCWITMDRLKAILMDNGFGAIASARCDQYKEAFSLQDIALSHIMVVNGKSAYGTLSHGESTTMLPNGEDVLRINIHDTIGAYLTELQNPRVECKDSELVINSGDLRISFQRTLRVPETKQTHDLPADFGKFPMYSMSSVADKLLQSHNASMARMAKKGGVFIPMYQREACFIKFQSDRKRDEAQPFALRVFAGGVNAISGEPWNIARKGKTGAVHGSGSRQDRQQSQRQQDYITVPPQPWLDGIVGPNNTAHQFVAMPLGAGYSIEKQITGREDLGGFQIEIISSWPDLKVLRDFEFSGEGEDDPEREDDGETLNEALTPAALGLQAGDCVLLDAEDVSEMYSQVTGFRFPVLVRDVFMITRPQNGLHRWQAGSTVPLVALYPLFIHIRFYDSKGRPHAPEQRHPIDPGESLLDCLTPIYDTKYKLEEFAYMMVHDTIDSAGHGQVVPLDPHAQIGTQALTSDNAFIKAVWKECTPLGRMQPDPVFGGGYDGGLAPGPDVPGAPRIIHQDKEQVTGWDMAVGAGGSISQTIFRDLFPAYTWTQSGRGRTLLTVQILNSVVFESLTGMLAPPTPVTYEEYVRAGIPFYTIYGEHEGVNEGGVEGFDGVKSVGVIDALASGGGIQLGTSIASSRSVGCTACKVRLCDCILRPCNHAWCARCVDTKMTSYNRDRQSGRDGRNPAGAIVSCRLCNREAEQRIGFSAPMGLPGHEIEVNLKARNVVVLPPLTGEMAFMPVELDARGTEVGEAKRDGTVFELP